MKIEASADRTLDNGAVFAHIAQIANSRSESDSKSKPKKNAPEKPKSDFEYITSKVNEYFGEAISKGHLPDYGNLPKEHMSDAMTRLKKFDLVKSEMLMLVNLKPQDAIFLDCIVEEIDIRHPSDEDQGEILEIINSAMGGTMAQPEDGDEEMAEEASDGKET